MNELAWLLKHRFQSLTRREFDWAITFDQKTNITVGCLWRLLESGRIRFTSEDDGQRFGLPAPVDAAAEVNRRLAGAAVIGVELRQGILDLEIKFSTGHILQIIPDSSGYDAWNASGLNGEFIAVGGGELTTFDDAAGKKSE
jgi:hypothetical protein